VISAKICGIENRLDGIESIAIKMKFFNPIPGIGDEEFSHRGRLVAIEVYCVGPFIVVVAGFVIVRKLIKAIVADSKMIVDEIENHTNSDGMRSIDKPAKVGRLTIQVRGSEQQHAVVTPAKPAVKLSDRHQFDDRDTDAGQLLQFTFGRTPIAFLGKSTDVHLIDHLAMCAHAPPRVIRPLERARVDDLR
jgi:hypothetical protein